MKNIHDLMTLHEICKESLQIFLTATSDYEKKQAKDAYVTAALNITKEHTKALLATPQPALA